MRRFGEKWKTVSESVYSEEQLEDARRRLQVCVARIEKQLEHGGEWLLPGEYTLADIKWFFMMPGVPRLAPELCNDEVSPRTIAWLQRMNDRPAVQAVAAYRPQR
jgi:glutathione S-transferase